MSDGFIMTQSHFAMLSFRGPSAVRCPIRYSVLFAIHCLVGMHALCTASNQRKDCVRHENLAANKATRATMEAEMISPRDGDAA